MDLLRSECSKIITNTKIAVEADIDCLPAICLIIQSYLIKPRNNLCFVLEKMDQDAELLGSDCRPTVGGQSLEKYLLKESIVRIRSLRETSATNDKKGCY